MPKIAPTGTEPQSTFVTTQAGQSFLERALDKTPGFVVAFVGSILGVSLCFIAVLQLGGLAVPVNNYLTSALSPQVRSLETSVSELRGIVLRIEALEGARIATEARLQTVDSRSGKLELEASDHARRLGRIERRLGINP